MRKLRRRQESTPFLLLTPFIDVLLVLICFILSISFNIQFAVEVNLPEAETGKMVLEKTLTVSILRDGNLVFQGKTVSLEGFPSVLAESLKKYPAGTKPQAVISGDEEIPYSRLIQVMDAFRVQGVTDLSLLTKNTGKS